MWILILTLVIEGGNSAPFAPAITAVSGFTSEATCLAAAQKWQQNMPAHVYKSDRRHALCAKA